MYEASVNLTRNLDTDVFRQNHPGCCSINQTQTYHRFMEHFIKTLDPVYTVHQCKIKILCWTAISYFITRSQSEDTEPTVQFSANPFKMFHLRFTIRVPCGVGRFVKYLLCFLMTLCCFMISCFHCCGLPDVVS